MLHSKAHCLTSVALNTSATTTSTHTNFESPSNSLLRLFWKQKQKQKLLCSIQSLEETSLSWRGSRRGRPRSQPSHLPQLPPQWFLLGEHKLQIHIFKMCTSHDSYEPHCLQGSRSSFVELPRSLPRFTLPPEILVIHSSFSSLPNTRHADLWCFMLKLK